MESLGIPLSGEGLGIAGLFLFALFSLFRGWLLPGIWVDKLLKNKDDQLAEKDKMIATLMEFQGPVIRLIETLNNEAEQKDKP